MISITKQEAAYMRSKKMGYLVHISSATHKGRAKRYYLTETPQSLKMIERYRKDRVTYSYGEEVKKRRPW